MSKAEQAALARRRFKQAAGCLERSMEHVEKALEYDTTYPKGMRSAAAAYRKGIALLIDLAEAMRNELYLYPGVRDYTEGLGPVLRRIPQHYEPIVETERW